VKRRDLLKSVSGLAAAALAPAPAIWSPAKADARGETLLIVSEGGPNNLDIHGVGTNVSGYEVSWNCYDRLLTKPEQLVIVDEATVRIAFANKDRLTIPDLAIRRTPIPGSC
jgi:hypothetical protein